MDSPREIDELTFIDYLRPVWRFKVIVVLAVALAAAGAYYYSNRDVKVYKSATQLYVGQSDIQQLLNPSFGAQNDRFVANQAGLVVTPAIAAVVRRRLKLAASPDALLGAVQAAPDSSTDFLTISAQSTIPRLAANLANGFAQAYLETRSTSLLKSVNTALSAARHQLAHTPGGANKAVRLALRQQISEFRANLLSPPSPGEQVSSAPVPIVPISPKPKRNAIFGGVIALVLAVIGSYLFDRSDRRVRRPDEVETLFDLPVLATVPHVRRVKPPRDEPHGSSVALREPLRTLRVNLDLARAETRAKVVMVTSALPSEGKSTIVRNLAISYREAKARVAVVEADLRRPVLAEQFGVDEGPGLSDALADGGPLRMQRVPSGSDDVDGEGSIEIAVAGASYENPTVLLTTSHLSELTAGLASDYDVVLVDSPPLLSVSDGLPLLSIVDGVLVVVRAGTSTHPAATRLRRTIERIQGVHLLGAVVNDVADELASYYYPTERAAVPDQGSS